MRQASHYLAAPTTGQGLYDVTAPVGGWTAAQGIANGLLTVWCGHTSASLLIQANADFDLDRDEPVEQDAQHAEPDAILIVDGNENPAAPSVSHRAA